MRKLIKTLITIVLSISLTSFTPIVLMIDLKLMESGWNNHFNNHVSFSEQPHLDFVKFQTLDETKTFMVEMRLPPNFDPSKLKKGTVFEVGLADFGKIESINEEIKINVKNKQDLERYEIRMMMELKQK